MSRPFLPALLLSVAALGVAPAPSVAQVVSTADGRSPITSLPATILAPGSYVVTRTMRGVAGLHGITVQADDVTIDLNGHTLVGVAGSLTGVHLNGSFTRLTIRNGNVVGWGTNGVDAATGTDVRVERLNASGCGAHGIVSGSRATVERCFTSGNGIAGILGQNRVRVLHCTAEDHPVGGIRIDDSGLVEGCQTRNNGQVGILCGPLSVVRDCLSRGNQGNPGFGISLVEAGTVLDSIAFDNAGHGIVTGGRSQVRGCSSHQNGLTGIRVADASLVADCVVNGNAMEGISANAFGIVRGALAHSNGDAGIKTLESLVERSLAIGNAKQGIYGLAGDTIRECHSNQNSGAGIRIDEEGLVHGNHVRDNAATGIYAEKAGSRVSANHLVGNLIGVAALDAFITVYKNSLLGNATDFQQVGGADIGPSIQAQDSDIDDVPFANIVPAVTPL